MLKYIENLDCNCAANQVSEAASVAGDLLLSPHEPPDDMPPPDTVGCIQHLGGLLKSYHRKAA